MCMYFFGGGFSSRNAGNIKKMSLYLTLKPLSMYKWLREHYGVWELCYIRLWKSLKLLDFLDETPVIWRFHPFFLQVYLDRICVAEVWSFSCSIKISTRWYCRHFYVKTCKSAVTLVISSSNDYLFMKLLLFLWIQLQNSIFRCLDLSLQWFKTHKRTRAKSTQAEAEIYLFV